jgi:2-C-methyl-D-erythritol 4-phosphate cytidylyltransferase
VAGSPDNIKITYPKDLIIAREILKNKLSTSH